MLTLPVAGSWVRFSEPSPLVSVQVPPPVVADQLSVEAPNPFDTVDGVAVSGAVNAAIGVTVTCAVPSDGDCVPAAFVHVRL